MGWAEPAGNRFPLEWWDRRVCTTDGGGGIVFSRLLKAGRQVLDEREVERRMFKLLFRVYDADGSGAIDSSELKLLFHDIGVLKGKDELLNVPDDALADVVDELDEDGSGKVEWSEFWAWITEGGFKSEFLHDAVAGASPQSDDSSEE